MNDEQLLILLRDCFTGGYTLPQFCIDNGIKRPLFVAEGKFWQFVWEIYVQFHYDKRMTAQFSFLNVRSTEIYFPAHPGIIKKLTVKNISEINPADVDAVICLSSRKIFSGGKVIYLDALTNYFISKTYVEIPLLHFLQRYPQVKLILTNYPDIKYYKGGKDFNSQLCSVEEFTKRLSDNDSGNVKTSLDKFGYTNAQALEIASSPKVKTNPDGSTLMEDTAEHSLQRIKNGKRMTAYQPANFRNKIYFVGQCIYYGIYAPFDKTIESYLQQMLNEKNLPYRVENESQFISGRTQDLLYNLNKLTPAPGDIIFVVIEGQRSTNNKIPFFDVNGVFNPPHDYREIYCTQDHVNELGYKILAEKFFELLTQNNFFRDANFKYPPPSQPIHRYGIPPQFETAGTKNFSNPELDTYKQQLRAKKIPVGALVMNCNPFTLGHRYIVEYAAAKVLKLYIFVVEEDKSEFPFADRIELVRQGVKDFANVEVLPSGKFIISQQTFSGYFNKAELQDVQVDLSQDVEIFATEIAPTLGITIRFAGEEPTDNVTRQYNETMREILPRHGIEFCEIPRKTFGDEVISASTVREALKRGDFDKIKNLVPPATLMYLRGRYSVTR